MEPLNRAKEWANNSYFDENARKEIANLIDAGDEKEIVDRFYKDLEFGTGGLRSTIGMGSNRINIYTIRKATQALANVLKKDIASAKVAISYDSRKFSKEFAMEAAAILAANQIHSYIFDKLNPVPLLSFSVRHHQADAGIMITASHNPPEYNGYKLYWNDGGQVTPPYDKIVIDEYNNIDNWNNVQFETFNTGLEKGFIHWVGEDVENAYHKALLKNSINPQMCKSNGDRIKIVYTPIHGTGAVPCIRALQDLGFTNVLMVEEQAAPDSNFSTVKSPNPEDPAALAMAVNLLKKEGADIAMGTDPDTDRVGVAVKHNDEIYYLNGNQIAVLLMDFILNNLKTQGKMPPNPLVIKTIVTSEMQTALAKHYNINIENTLTGFKWFGERMTEIERKKLPLDFIFASEESYGYLGHTEVRDKDAVNAVALVAEMALWYKLQDKTIIDVLHELYEKHGYYQEGLVSLGYKGKDGAEKITRIMTNFREIYGKVPLPNICGEKIVAVEDYLSSKKKDFKTNNTEDINLPKSNVLSIILESGNKIFLRPSGTEPKIKFYLMVRETGGNLDMKKKNAETKIKAFEKFLTMEADKA